MIFKFIDNNGSEITVNSLSSLQALVESDTIKEDTKIKAGLRGKWTTASKINELVFPKEEILEPEEPKEDIKSFIIKEELKEEVKDELKEEIKEEPKEEIKEKPKEEVKDEPKEEIKEEPKEEIKEKPKEEIKKKPKEEESTKDTSDYYTEVFMKKDYNDENGEENQVKEEEELEEIEELEEEDNNDTAMKKRKRSKKNKYDDDNVIGFTLIECWKIGFKKAFDYSGRASRSEYWKFIPLFVILYFILLFGIFMIIVFNDPYISDNTLNSISWILSIPVWILSLSVTIRRLHDTDRSGWWFLLSFVPILGLVLLFMVASKGTEGRNRFGNYPLRLKKNS